MGETWKSDLERWLAPFLGAFRHKAGARLCPVYVAGLIGAEDPKSIQPMAARHKRSAEMSLRGPPCPHCGWP